MKDKRKYSKKPNTDRANEAKSLIKETEENVRLNKFLANAGVCSRREADKMIADGLVKVNGIVITEMGYKVTHADEVKCQGKLLKKQQFRYLLLNKPKDYITTVTDTHGRRTVMDLIGNACAERIYPVGRLDRNTTGLLLFTNDGDLAKKLTHPSFRIKKIYQVTVDKSVKEEDVAKLKEGIELEDGQSKFDEVFYTAPPLKRDLTVEIHSGKNRIVRRMFEALGYEVVKLDRIEFAGLTKGKVTRGKYRFLEKKEVGFLKMQAPTSMK